VKFVQVVVSLARLLLRGVFGCWFQGASRWIVGKMVWLGEIPMLLQDDDNACGRHSLLEGIVWALPSFPSRATGETLDLLVQAVASLLRRSLGGALFGLLMECHFGLWNY
jgi:hypothetical protein